jgi:hypothetical protein
MVLGEALEPGEIFLAGNGPRKQGEVTLHKPHWSVHIQGVKCPLWSVWEGLVELWGYDGAACRPHGPPDPASKPADAHKCEEDPDWQCYQPANERKGG